MSGSFKSTIKVPLIADGRPVGLFCGHSPSKLNFSNLNVEQLNALVQRAIAAILAARAHGESMSPSDWIQRKLDLRQEIDRAASTAPNLSNLLEGILDIAL